MVQPVWGDPRPVLERLDSPAGARPDAVTPSLSRPTSATAHQGRVGVSLQREVGPGVFRSNVAARSCLSRNLAQRVDGGPVLGTLGAARLAPVMMRVAFAHLNRCLQALGDEERSSSCTSGASGGSVNCLPVWRGRTDLAVDRRTCRSGSRPEAQRISGTGP